jgi:hypothetical protein
MSEIELVSKCHRLADSVIGPAKVDRLIHQVSSLEKMQSAGDLSALLE